MTLNAAQHETINLLKTLRVFLCVCDYVSQCIYCVAHDNSSSSSVAQRHRKVGHPCFRGSHTNRTCVLHMTLNYVTSVYTCRGKRSKSSYRGQEAAPKRKLRRELQSISKAIPIPLAKDPPASLPLWGLEEPCPARLYSPAQHCSSTSHSSRYILPIGDLCGEHVGMWHPYTTNIVKATPQDQQCKTKPKET